MFDDDRFKSDRELAIEVEELRRDGLHLQANFAEAKLMERRRRNRIAKRLHEESRNDR